MKSLTLAVLGCFGGLAAVVLGEEIFLPESARLAQTETALLDPNALVAEPPATATADVPPVLETSNPAEIPATPQAKLVDRKWKMIWFGGFRVASTDNLFISATDRRADVSFQVSPGVALGWGNYEKEVRQLGGSRPFESLHLTNEDLPQNFIFGSYQATASFFDRNHDENAVDHDALIAGRWEASKLTLGMRLRFQTLSGPDIDVGDRAQRTVYGGEITSNYALSEKTSLEVNLYNRSYDFDDQLDWSEWVVEDWLNFQVLPKTRLSLGSRLGTAVVESASTQTFEQLVARAMYLPSPKLGLSLDGGVEWRQYGNDGGDDLFGVFNFTATYTPFDGTQFAASAFRRNSASVALVGENITATGVTARGRQRILQRYYLTVEGGFEDAEYLSTQTGQSAGREDETTYVKPSISFDVTKYLSAEAAYQYRHNESSRADLSFSENVVSFQLNLQF